MITKTTLYHYFCNQCDTSTYITWRAHHTHQFPYCSECGEDQFLKHLGEVSAIENDDLASLEQSNKDLRRQNNNLRKFKERVKRGNQ